MQFSSSLRRPVRALVNLAAEAQSGHEVGQTILLAEDDAAVRSLLVRVLRSHGYSVTEAADGAIALALVEAAPEPFQLLLTDVMMPGLNGPDLVDHVRARGYTPRVIYITGYADAPINTMGTDLVLRKPFSPATLTQAVRQVLTRA